MAEVPILTPEDLAEACRKFQENEPRDLFYRVATTLVDLALRKQAAVTLSEALAVLLQTWNSAYYRFRKFDAAHFVALDGLLAEHLEVALAFRERSIHTLSEADADAILTLFAAFERILGPVGVAKVLHLLAPEFFPLWDRAIAVSYGVGLGPTGTNTQDYFSFMRLVQEQVRQLRGKVPTDLNLLKAIDEYNYCRYTKGW